MTTATATEKELPYSGAFGDSVRDEIRAHAQEEYENEKREACGLIVSVGKKQKVFRCRNIYPPPDFKIHPEDIIAAEAEGEVLLSYHSQPDKPATPSYADKYSVEKNKLPMLIVGWPVDVWSVYEPTGWVAPLEGRPYVYGLLDCYSLLQDYYARELNIILPDFDRPFEWWNEGLDLFRENFPKNGFVKIEAVQPNAIILMGLRSPVPNHGAVYLNDGIMLHHPADRLSTRTVYLSDRGFWAHATMGYIIHESLL